MTRPSPHMLQKLECQLSKACQPSTSCQAQTRHARLGSVKQQSPQARKAPFLHTTVTSAASSNTVSKSEEYRTYTNPEGKVLSKIAENVWAAERPFLWNTVDVNGKMAVLRLQDGSLWVHSPVELDKPLQEALAELGPVKHIVSPNFEHVTFASQWQAAYPEARLYACPGLRSKKPDTKFDEELGENDCAPAYWAGEVECTCLTYERNPFNGKPFFNEVVFLHKPSRFLIVSDFYWNYPPGGTQLRTQAWKFGMDKIYAPFYRSFMIRKKDEFELAKRRIFSEWDFEGIIPCHGDVLYSGGKEALRQQLGLC